MGFHLKRPEDVQNALLGQEVPRGAKAPQCVPQCGTMGVFARGGCKRMEQVLEPALEQWRLFLGWAMVARTSASLAGTAHRQSKRAVITILRAQPGSYNSSRVVGRPWDCAMRSCAVGIGLLARNS